MGMIEEIKERVSQFKTDWEASRGCCDVEDFSDDVFYLLSRIRIAEESLQTIVDNKWNIRPDGEAWEYVGEFNDSIKVAQKTLEQIQKEG